jgi:hypothetical protein
MNNKNEILQSVLNKFIDNKNVLELHFVLSKNQIFGVVPVEI